MILVHLGRSLHAAAAAVGALAPTLVQRSGTLSMLCRSYLKLRNYLAPRFWEKTFCVFFDGSLLLFFIGHLVANMLSANTWLSLH